MTIRLLLATSMTIILLLLANYTILNQSKVVEAAVSQAEPQKLALESDSLVSWREYSSTVGQFHILFPAYPQHANEVVPIPNTTLFLQYDIYVAEPDESSSYMLSLITYPDEVKVGNPENVLQTVMNEMLLANPTNKLKGVDLSTFGEYPQLEFQITNNEILMYNRAIMVGQTLYLLTVTQMLGEEAPKVSEKFIQSFQILDDSDKSSTAADGPS